MEREIASAGFCNYRVPQRRSSLHQIRTQLPRRQRHYSHCRTRVLSVRPGRQAGSPCCSLTGFSTEPLRFWLLDTLLTAAWFAGPCTAFSGNRQDTLALETQKCNADETAALFPRRRCVAKRLRRAGSGSASGDPAPDVLFRHELGTCPTTAGQEPLLVYVMTRMWGLSHLDYILVYRYPKHGLGREPGQAKTSRAARSVVTKRVHGGYMEGTER